LEIVSDDPVHENGYDAGDFDEAIEPNKPSKTKNYPNIQTVGNKKTAKF
jgi:hypothetical protein